MDIQRRGKPHVNIAQFCLSSDCLSQFACEFLAEKTISRNYVFGGADPLMKQVLQAAPNGLAHQQCARQYSRGNCHPGHDRKVRAPVIEQITKYEPPEPDFQGFNSGSKKKVRVENPNFKK